MKYFSYFLISFFLIFVSSCNSKSKNSSDSGANSNNKTIKKESNQIPSNSLGDIFAYGQGIIDDKITPSDNQETFACLDSLNSNKFETRKFFFKVYKVISQKADGALSDVIPMKFKEYFFQFTKEALANYKTSNAIEKSIFIENLADNFISSANASNTEVDSFFVEIEKRHNLTEQEKKELLQIKKTILDFNSPLNGKNKKLKECKLEKYSHSELESYHNNNCIETNWPYIFRLDLNDDGVEEEFWIAESYGKGGFYALFIYQNKKWNLISNKASINVNHMGPHILDEKNKEFHSFMTYEGTSEFTWIWKNGKYILKNK